MTTFYGVPATRCMTRYGTMMIPSQDQVIGKSLSLYGEWGEHEIETISRFLRDGPGIVDVGANIGTHSMAFASRFPESTIYSFEPQPFSFMLLANNIAQNALDNVQLYNVACSFKTDIFSADFDYDRINKNHGSLSLVDVETSHDVAVPVAMGTLDSIIGDKDIQFVKIDVEGYELQVLEGMGKILKAQRPILYLEILSLERLWPIRDILLRNDYNLRWIETSAFNENNYNFHPENIWNHCEIGVLAFPEERVDNEDLPRVRGTETEIPWALDPLFRYQGSEFNAAAAERRRANDAAEEIDRLRTAMAESERVRLGAMEQIEALVRESSKIEQQLASANANVRRCEAQAETVLGNAVSRLDGNSLLLRDQIERLGEASDRLLHSQGVLSTTIEDVKHGEAAKGAHLADLESQLRHVSVRHDRVLERNELLRIEIKQQMLETDRARQRIATEHERPTQDRAMLKQTSMAQHSLLDAVIVNTAQIAEMRDKIGALSATSEEVHVDMGRLVAQLEKRRWPIIFDLFRKSS